MKVHLSTKALAGTVAHLERVIPPRSSNLGLSSLLARLTDSELVFSGTNMEIDLEAKLTADVTGSEGSWAIPAQVFGQVVRALPAETVELEFDDREVRVTSGNFDTKLQLTDPTQTPVLSFPAEFPHSLPSELLSRLLANVRYAAAVNDYQAVFRGIRLELHEGHSRAVASDGFRLAWYHSEESSGIDADFILPAKAVEEITRLLDGTGTAALALTDGQLSLKSGGYRMNVKLMEGNFPDYNRIIPRSMALEVTLRGSELQEAVARVSVLADPGSNNRIDVYLDGNLATITAEGGFGGAREEVTITENKDGGQLALSYNARYLLEAIKPLSGDVQLNFSGPTTPTIIKGVAEPGYLAMVVPLKTVVD